MKKRSVIIIAVIAVLVIAGIVVALLLAGKDGDPSSDEGAPQETVDIEAQELFYEDIEVLHFEQEETDGLYYVDAEVRIIDYSSYMEKVFDDADSSSESEEEFQKKFYEAILEASEGAAKEEKTVRIELYGIDPEKTKWKDKEIEHLVKQQAFEDEINEFAIQKVFELMPEISESETEEEK